MKTRIPPLTAIRVFDVASQQLSFAKTAEILGVSQSAVSKQISLLEEYVGAKLFERSASGVTLTFEGRELKQTVAPAFDVLEKGFERYSRTSRYTNTMRIATLPSFAALCLAPRLNKLESAFPDDTIEILTSDRVADLSRESIDVSIRFGAGDWSDVVATPISEATLVPVCARHVLDKYSTIQADALSGERRIQSFLVDEWMAYDKHHGLVSSRVQNKIVLEHFLVAIEAAVAGQGAALLPDPLVRPHLARGDLAQLGEPLPWHEAFYLCHLPNAHKAAKIQTLIDWLTSELE